MSKRKKPIPIDPNDKQFRLWLHRLATGAMKDAIRAHGPITNELVNSAAKRIAGRICGELKANGETKTTT